MRDRVRGPTLPLLHAGEGRLRDTIPKDLSVFFPPQVNRLNDFLSTEAAESSIPR